MDSDTFGDFMLKLWRLSGSLIYYVFPIKIPDNLQTNLPCNLHKSNTLYAIFI